ncbi:MAG: transposase [Clostridia bacterium]|nr:transposase [Clostridia bacterium]
MVTNGDQCYSLSVRNAFLEQLQTIRVDYENLMNEQRKMTADGKRHNKFSCRDSSTELPIPLCVRFMVCMKSGDIHQELTESRLFDPTKVPSGSTYCQTRNKIPLQSLQNLFQWSSNTYYWNTKPAGTLDFTIFGVDGSEISYPANEDEPDNYIKTRSAIKARNVIHVNACVDTDRMFIVDVICQNGHDKDERSAHYEFIKRKAMRIPNLDQRKFLLFTTDRGYEAWNLPVVASVYGVSYLCRIKAEDSNGILSGIKNLLPISRNSFDWNITITLTRDSSKKGREGYHYLNPNVFCEFVTPEKDYTITIRVTKIRISDSITEYLFSNLDKSIYSKECLKKLYFRRWPCETTFSFLKYPLCLSSPHGSSCEPVLKELWCRLTMFNIVSTIVYHDSDIVEKKENTGRKYDYTRDFSSSISDVRVFLLSDEEYDLDQVIRRQLRPIREKKPTERNKNPRKQPCFGHRG